MFQSVVKLTAVLGLLSGVVVAEDWSQWRGPNRNNVAPGSQSVPAEWSETQNVIWKSEIPGRGHASPVVTGNLVVLCTASDQQQIQSVAAFERTTGKPAWSTEISRGGFPVIHPKNTHASATAVSNGSQLFAVFSHHEKVEAVALDMNGRILWRRDVGGFRPQAYEYGYASSPTLYGDLLIVSADSDTVAWVKALSVSTGDVVWEQKRPQYLNWSSPIVTRIAGRDQLLLSGLFMISSYDPATGAPLWQTKCLTMATCGTCIWDKNLIFASGGYPDPQTVAVFADGSGVAWSNTVKCYEQSMLAHDGYVYAFSDQGIVHCWEGSTGREMWRQRLQGPVSTSPLMVGDLIYATNEAGTTWVFRANPQKYEQVSKNQLGDSGFASMVAVDNKLYIRTAKGEGPLRRETLYCIGSK